MLKHIVSGTKSAGMARLWGALAYALALIWFAAALAAALLAVRTFELSGLALVGVELGVIVVAALGISLFTEWGDLYGQRRRDLAAQGIYQALQHGEETPSFTLYLRPFASTNAISETEMGLSIGGSAMSVGLGALTGERLELEAQIEKAVRPLGPLVGLGAPLEHFGAGRIAVGEDEWRAAIRKLMERAALIIMLPSSRAGTLEEIALVLTTPLIRKTVFLDPPNSTDSKRYRQAEEWRRVQQAFSEHGFALPKEKRRGALMFFGGEKTPLLKERLDIDAEDNIERLFRRVIDRVGQTHAA